jgi:hypothetical protein
LNNKKFHSKTKPSVIDLTKGNDVPAVERAAPRTTWPEFRYYQTDEQWQQEKCRQLNLVYARSHHFVEPGGPNVILKRPNLRAVVKGVGDGNCLFRCFSYILTGSQDQHMAIRMAIVAHMRSIALRQGKGHAQEVILTLSNNALLILRKTPS